jgi:hypothetical protein
MLSSSSSSSSIVPNSSSSSSSSYSSSSSDSSSSSSEETNCVDRTVYYTRLVHNNLNLNRDSNKNCSNDPDKIESISGTYMLGANESKSFRFWRNIHSTCGDNTDLDLSNGDVERITIIKTTGGGTVISNTLLDQVQTIPITMDGINYQDKNGVIVKVPNLGNISNSNLGHILTITAGINGLTFTIEARIEWSSNTDHDLYGLAYCDPVN